MHIPLFNVRFPETANVVVEKLTMIATFDLLPTDDMYDSIMEVPENKDIEYFDELTKERLENADYESNFLIANLGTLFITFLVLLSVPMCVCASGPCKQKSPWIHRARTSTQASIRGNMWIRYLMEASLDVSISGTINLIVAFENGSMPVDSAFQIMNTTMMLVVYTVNMAFPGIILFFYLRNFSKWTEKDFDKKYGAIF